MKKSIVFAITLLANLHAHANYLFINVTDRDHSVEINGATIINNGSASLAEQPSYKVVVKEKGGKKRETVFTPTDPSKKVVAITFGEILRRPYATQYTLEKAKKKYGKRIQFAK